MNRPGFHDSSGNWVTASRSGAVCWAPTGASPLSAHAPGHARRDRREPEAADFTGSGRARRPNGRTYAGAGAWSPWSIDHRWVLTFGSAASMHGSRTVHEIADGMASHALQADHIVEVTGCSHDAEASTGWRGRCHPGPASFGVRSVRGQALPLKMSHPPAMK